jgi:outer membrane protein assembly factor BamA
MAKHFLFIFAIACVSVLNLRAEDADAKGETKKAIAIPASPANGAVINYQPILSGVFEYGLHEKIIEKLAIFQQVSTPPSTIAQLKNRVVNDMKVVDVLLRDLGYYDALADYEIDLKTNPITLNFMVRTGPQYKLLKFNLSSNSLDNQLFNALSLDPARFNMIPGTPATLENIKQGVRRLFEILGNNGYPYVKVLNEKITVDHDQKGIEVLLHMDPGKLVRFGETAIAPAEGIDQDFIKKRLKWKKGDVYSNLKVIQTIETLNNTQQYAFVKITRPNKQPDGSSLIMRVEAFPESTRTFAWKTGYDANNNFNVKLGWKGINLFDDGSLIKVLGGFGQYYNGLAFEHIVPDAFWTESYLTTRFDVKRTHTNSYSGMAAELSSILTTPIYDK